jgi:hypothetical protein
MVRFALVIAVAAGACARAGNGIDIQGDDGPDMGVDAPPVDAPCTKQTFYQDGDKDGHGDPARAVQECTMPAGTVTSNDDCDDTTAERRPGLAEICDALDNDCNPATVETCPQLCVARRRPPPDHGRAYLICNGIASWTNLQTFCTAQGYGLVQIESADENNFIRQQANQVAGAGSRMWLAGTDAAAEGSWVWQGTGDPFWSGGPAGAPVGGRFTFWLGGEPNNDSNEDCAEMRGDGGWNDAACGDDKFGICKR